MGSFHRTQVSRVIDGSAVLQDHFKELIKDNLIATAKSVIHFFQSWVFQMNRKEQIIFGILGLFIAACACIAAWLVWPPLANIFVSPTRDASSPLNTPLSTSETSPMPTIANSLTPTLTFTPTPSPTPPPSYELNYQFSYNRRAGGPHRGASNATISCQPGYIATGLLGMKGDYITGIGLYCSWLNSDGTTGSVSTTEVRGNNGGTYWDNLVCPPNKALTKLSGTAWNYVDTIRGDCTYVDGSEYSETGLEGEGGTNDFDSACDPGYFVTGLMIKWGDYIDGLTMICTQVLKK